MPFVRMPLLLEPRIVVMTSEGLFARAVCDVEVGVSRIRKTEFYGQK